MQRHGRLPRWLLPTASLTLAVLVAAVYAQQGQQFIQYGFETRDPIFAKGSADARFTESAHSLTDQTAHTGKRSEYIRLEAEPGSFIHYTYDVGRAPVSDELTTSIWVKANRPGTQLLCRVVLPHERNPNDLGQPLTVLAKGDKYQLTSRWQPLTLRQPDKRLREQQQILQAELKHQVDVSDAYVDRLVLNVYSGPGLTEVWLDDLEVGPVLESKPVAPPAPRGVTGRPAVNRRTAVVTLEGNKLLVSSKAFFPRIIRHTGTPLKTLRDAGFNTVVLDESTPPGLIDDAAALGFWIVPSVNPPTQEGTGPAQLTSNNETFARAVSRFLDQDAVLWWDLGNNLEYEKYPSVNQAARAFRAVDPMRPVSADVWDGFKRYSVGIDQMLIGVHRWPLLTGMELPGYCNWLLARRRLTQGGTFCWTWVQTHLPDWFLQTAYGKNGPGGGPNAEPLGPQPEQIRLLAYTAIGAGYRGLGFWSDRFLSDIYTGRDRLLALALLNQEIELLEPLLVNCGEPKWIETSNKDIKAAVLRTDNAVLVLPIWMGPGSQFVPGQGAVPEVSLTVPQVPAGSWAYEISPGQVRSLPWERVLGGTKVSLHEFSLTSAVVFTADLSPTGLVVKFQERQRSMAKMAAQYAHDLAQEELAKVDKVNGRLEQAGHRLPDGQALLTKARAYLASCDDHRRNGRHGEAYAEAQRALRPLRILMRAHWELAVRPLTLPVSSPYAVSFYTLPQHWQFVDEITSMHTDANVLPEGDFEWQKIPAGWYDGSTTPLDPVVAVAKPVEDSPKEGRQCLLLQIKPKDAAVVPAELERTFLAIDSRKVKLAPGTKVCISAWIRVPEAIQASQDGALLYDSAGGEPLAVRVVFPTGWKKYILYREVPASGEIYVTMALTGIGRAFFDDVRIEPLVAGAAAPPAQADGSSQPTP